MDKKWKLNPQREKKDLFFTTHALISIFFRIYHEEGFTDYNMCEEIKVEITDDRLSLCENADNGNFVEFTRIVEKRYRQ